MPQTRSTSGAAPGPVFAAVVLAAGRSSRFTGGHKLLAEVAGIALVRRVLEQVAASPIGDIAAVVSVDGGAVRAAAGEGRWRFVENVNAGEGLSTSIRAGLSALPESVAGALIVLADMPGVTSDLIAHVLQTAAANPRAIVHPVTGDGRQGHPVWWPRDLFAELMTLEGDAGAKPLLKMYANRVVTIAAGGADAVTDIDTPADLATFTGRAPHG